ncbi:MAG: hypothetical protein FJ267_14100, partial [Planctomycetes bacterium]|nr:hypothetical protein [Planctomycetota bacterium]
SDLSFGIRVSKPKDPPDTTAPKATLSVSGTIAPTRSLQVQFSEPMKGLSRPLSRSALRRLARTNSDSAANLANYTLTRTDGTAQVISIHRVTRVDKSSVQINFETPLVAGTYRLDISPVLADLAGNAISDPKSFTFTVA